VALIDKFDSVIGAFFSLELDKHQAKGIMEVSGLKAEYDMIEVKTQTADGKYVVNKIVGRPKTGTVSVTRLLTEDTQFADWLKEAAEGKLPRTNARIEMYATDMSRILGWTLSDCQPASIELSTLKAGATDPTTEKLTLHHTGITIEKG
jgi:phage tail-like protein